jgi:hypothetical protein
MITDTPLATIISKNSFFYVHLINYVSDLYYKSDTLMT